MNHSKLKYWIKASRPRAFPLAGACISMGALLAAQEHKFQWLIFGLTLLTALLLQLLSNLANDAGDAINGADHVEREGPARMVQTGDISLQSMKTAIKIIAVLSIISGVLLIYLGIETWKDAFIYLGLGLICVLAAIGYTMGKRPYGYMGLGDLSVFLFFGLVGVTGTYYLQTHIWDPLVLLPASTCGLFAVAVLNVNNIRDIDSDLKANKFTFAAQLGHRFSRIYQVLLVSLGLLTMVIYTMLTDGQWWFLGVTPFLIYNA